MRALPSVALVLLLASGCSSQGSLPEPELPAVPGLAAAASTADVPRTTDRLTRALDDADGVSVLATIDHSQNAQRVGMGLAPTRVVVFGNPVVGTPLLQANPVVGIDLPQKMLVYQAEDRGTVLAYNTPDYLAARHGLADSPALSALAGALDGFARAAAGDQAEIRSTPASSVTAGQGLVTRVSTISFRDTYSRLREGILLNGGLSIIAEVDHQANASSVGLSIGPNRLILFGNPSVGTPLMQASRTAGIDLPQSMLVYQAGGEVRVVYEDPAFLAERHQIPTSLEELETIRTVLSQLAERALVEAL